MIQTALFLFIYVYGTLVSFFKHPALIFCVYQCVFFFNPQQRWWGASLPNFSYSFYIACILLFLTFKVVLDKNEEKNSLRSPIVKTLFVFLILFTITYFLAVFPENHLEQLIYFTQSFVIICCAYLLANNMQKLRWYFDAYIVGASYLSFYTYQIGRNAGDRVIGIAVLDSVDSNSVAASIAPAAIVALHFIFTEKKIFLRIYYVSACVFIANALVLINSRGALLGLSIGGMFYLYQIYKSSDVIDYARSKAIALVFAALAGVIYVADDSAIERFQSIFEVSSKQVEVESGATRTHFWKAAIDMAKDHPMGLGYRGFNAYARFYIPEEVNTGRSRSRSVHSSWFEALSELGYIGLAVLLYLVYLSIKLSLAAKRYFSSLNDANSVLLVVALQGCLLTNFVAMTFISRMRGETFMWLLIFTAILYEITKRMQKQSETK
jgi:hypothetical protein